MLEFWKLALDNLEVAKSKLTTIIASSAILWIALPEGPRATRPRYTRKSLACKTLAPSAVAFATYTLRASAHPDTKCLFYCIGCVKHFPMQ